jgi:hypothetical protein
MSTNVIVPPLPPTRSIAQIAAAHARGMAAPAVVTHKETKAQFTEDLLIKLKGRVAIVGNATPFRPFGDLINSYDTVIRLNNYKLAGYEHLIGTKTDLRCTSGWADIESRRNCPEFSPFKRESAESVNLPKYEAANGGIATPRTDIHPLILETPKPSTGLSLVELTRQVGLPVDLFCFDGFKSPHYWSKQKEATTHSTGEFAALLARQNAIIFGETYDYASLYNFCHTNHSAYDENAGLTLIKFLQRRFSARKIIEFGAGNGGLSQHLESQGNRITAVEVSDAAFKKISCAHKIKGDAFTLATLNEHFDCFLSIDVLEHLTENDIRLVIREAGRLANTLFLSVSTRPSGLLGPNGENLHLTVKHIEWWHELVSRYFDITSVQAGFGTGQVVFEGVARQGFSHQIPATIN